MRGAKDNLIKTGLDALYYSGVYHLMAPATSGIGTMFMLHRVRQNADASAFAPNRILEVTPQFLDQTLKLLRGRETDIVDLDEAVRRLSEGTKRPFAVFTFDDGYADNFDTALPIFERYGAPFTVFITTGLLDGTADIWWLTLEEAIARLDTVRVRIGSQSFDLPARTAQAKQLAWDTIYWPLRDVSVAARKAVVAGLAAEAGFTGTELFAGMAPSWQRLKSVAHHPLVRLGAHTLSHPPLAALCAEDARREMIESRDRIQAETGQEIRHFAYPFGDPASAGARDFDLAREAGFASAVTTRRGPLFREHARHLHALPRVSLNGNYQSRRYVDLFLSGAPFALFNKGRRLDVA